MLVGLKNLKRKVVSMIANWRLTSEDDPYNNSLNEDLSPHRRGSDEKVLCPNLDRDNNGELLGGDHRHLFTFHSMSLSIHLFQNIFISREGLEEKCFVQKHFIKYFFILLFLLCFVTPVLITFSLNVFITFAVPNTTRMSGALGGYAPTGGFSSSVNCIG